MNQDIFVVIEHLRGQVADISYVMLAAARGLAEGTGGKVVGVLLGSNAQSLSERLKADQVYYIDHPQLADFSPEAYQKILAGLVEKLAPRAVLFGNTTIGADVAGVLSARLDLPMVNSCQTVTSDGHLISQICGGKIMAETALPDKTLLVSMLPSGYKPEAGQSDTPPAVTSFDAPALDDLHVVMKQYIEPEAGDVDISKEPILIGVGRGIQTQDNIELAQELADALGGVVCASRPVVDQGWLPTNLLVGKSGKSVKPKLYLALGISGAPEHSEGMCDSEIILAINMDPAAPIFDLATYGTTTDLFDLVPVLSEQIRQAKSG
jgi:electron transfer flavoprotein alpha subunit